MVLGHTITVEMAYGTWLNTIYRFHMALFFTVSGLLLNLERLRTESWGAFFGRYGQRMLLPWLVAWALGIASFVALKDPQVMDILKRGAFGEGVWLLLFPRHHPWFIPALFTLLAGLRIALKMRVPWWCLLLAGVLLDAVANGEGWNLIAPTGHAWLDITGNKLWIRFIWAFILGVGAQQIRWSDSFSRWRGSLAALSVLAALLYAATALTPIGPAWFSEIWRVLVVACFSAYCLGYALLDGWPTHPGVAWLSRETLFIYLWHPFIYKAIFAAFPQLVDGDGGSVWTEAGVGLATIVLLRLASEGLRFVPLIPGLVGIVAPARSVSRQHS